MEKLFSYIKITSYQQEYNNRHYSLDKEQGSFTNNSECSSGTSDIRYGDPEYIFNLGQRIGGWGGLALLSSQRNYSVSILLQATLTLKIA